MSAKRRRSASERSSLFAAVRESGFGIAAETGRAASVESNMNEPGRTQELHFTSAAAIVGSPRILLPAGRSSFVREGNEMTTRQRWSSGADGPRMLKCQIWKLASA